MAALAPDFTILRVNATLAECLDYRTEEMQGMPPERFTHPDDMERLKQHLADALDSGQDPAPIRKRCLQRGGGSRLCDVHLVRVGASGWLSQIEDVTDRERAIDLLERERRLFIGGPVVVLRWVNAPGWPVEYVSPNVKAEFGWDAAELMSGALPYADLVHPEDLDSVVADVAAHADAGHGTYEQTYRIKGRDGAWCWIRDFTVIHKDSDQVATHFEGYIFNDTARIVAEREREVRESDLLRLLYFSRRTLTAQSYEELARVVQSDLQERLGLSHALIYLCLAEEPRRARLLTGAGPALDLLQRDAGELALDEIPLLRAASNAGEAQYCLDARLDPHTTTASFRSFDARSLLVAPLHHADRTLSLLWTASRKDEGVLVLSAADLEYFRNLSGIVALAYGRIRSEEEGRSTQARLRQVGKLEAVGQLAGGVAHNFNNSLTVILGHASLLLDDAPMGSSLRAGLEAILRSGEGSAKAVSQLLQFARPHAASGFERIDPAASLTELAKMLRAVLDEPIRLVVRIDDDLPAVSVEGGSFTMILMNLVLNARDAMSGGGRLAIRAIGEQLQSARWLRIEVEDDGCGMSEVVQAHIFEPFFTTKGERGTGLGLAAVYGAVTRAGGTIELRSEVGRGSCFTIRLPETSDQAAGLVSNLEPRPGGDRRVLIVEDEEAVRAFVARALRTQGYRVESVSHARAALTMVARSRFDLVLADIVMHGMDGLELARKLGESPHSPPVLLMSGYPGSGLGVVLPPQARGLLHKPFTARQLVAAVESALGLQASPPDEAESAAE